MIEAAGFVDVQVAWRGRPFDGAAGQSKADKFDTEGVNIRARKSQAGAGWPESLRKDAVAVLKGKGAYPVNPRGAAARKVVLLYL